MGYAAVEAMTSLKLVERGVLFIKIIIAIIVIFITIIKMIIAIIVKMIIVFIATITTPHLPPSKPSQ